MVEMDLVEIQITGENGSQVIILQEKAGIRSFPIIIGNYEVIILDQTVRSFETSRPLTHDLVLNVLEGLGAQLSGVLVDDLRDNAFIGKLLIKKNDGTTERIDTRPSDAIVLAMKRKVPIYVEEHVLQSANLEEEDE